MDGSEVIRVLKGRRDNGPAAIIVRHAARYPITDIRTSLTVGLTEDGKRDARNFGSRLPSFKTIRIFHSPAVRCHETAEMIAEGAGGNGARLEMFEMSPSLCAPYLRDESCLTESARRGGEFIRAWFNGEFDESMILRTAHAADLVLEHIIARLGDGNGNGRLDIHVSHDWETMLLREELLGLKYETVGWMQYLDGLVFSRGAPDFQAIYRHHAASFKFLGGRRVLEVPAAAAPLGTLASHPRPFVGKD